jgi:hypothetical protein
MEFEMVGMASADTVPIYKDVRTVKGPTHRLTGPFTRVGLSESNFLISQRNCFDTYAAIKECVAEACQRRTGSKPAMPDVAVGLTDVTS